MSTAQPDDALPAIVELAQAAAALAGRVTAESAEDVDSVARRLAMVPGFGGWSGMAGDRAREEVADAVIAARVLAGHVLYLADVLRVEGARFAAAVVRWAAADGGADPGNDDDNGPRSETGAAVVDADRALTVRLREAADALAGYADPDTRPCVDVSGTTGDDPRALATLWHSLGPADRERWRRDHPELGTMAGLSSATRDALNRSRLRRLVEASDPGGGPTGSGVPIPEGTADGLRALAAHLEEDPRRRLLSLFPDGRAVVASGDPDVADRVVTLVPGTGSSLRDLGRTSERAEAICEAVGTVEAAGTAEAAASAGSVGSAGRPETVDARTECVAVSWQGYDAPQSIPEAAGSLGRATAHAADLRTYAAGLDAVESMDGRDAPHTAVGYSFGSAVLGSAASDPRGLAADRMIHVGSPGAGVGSIADQWVDEGGVARRATDREVVGVATRWDPVPWWSLTGVLGERPGTSTFGGLGVDVTEPGSGPHSVSGAHSAYFDPGTLSLEEIGRLVADSD